MTKFTDRCGERNGIVCRTRASFLSGSEASCIHGGSVGRSDTGAERVEASVSSNGTSVILRVERVRGGADCRNQGRCQSMHHHHGDYEDKEFDYVLGDEVDDYEDLDYEGLEDEL